jgi:hypothetical protein
VIFRIITKNPLPIPFRFMKNLPCHLFFTGGSITVIELDDAGVIDSECRSINGYFPQSQRQTQILILEIPECIPVVNPAIAGRLP